MRILKIMCPEDKAEGTVNIDGNQYAYNTELVNCNGVCFHVWLGDAYPDPDLIDHLGRRAANQRDVVYMTYSDGGPTGFWAHQDF